MQQRGASPSICMVASGLPEIACSSTLTISEGNMRVAVFSWESLHSISHGGLGVHTTELAAGLERRGNEVHVFTRRGPGQGSYDRIDGVHYHRVDHGISNNFVETMDWMCKALVHRFSEVTSLI